MRILGQTRSIFLIDDEIIQPLAFATLLATRRRRVSVSLDRLSPPVLLSNQALSNQAANLERPPTPPRTPSST
jgi:hypothetical protein